MSGDRRDCGLSGESHSVARRAHVLSSRYIDHLMIDVNEHLAAGWRLVTVVFADERQEYASAQSATTRAFWYAFLERADEVVDLTEDPTADRSSEPSSSRDDLG